MRSLLSTLVLALSYAITATADNAPAALEPRQGTASLSRLTCGSTSHTKQQVDAAVAEACRLHAAGQQLGDRKYPHQFKNFEGLLFAVSGPYQEFPILSSGVVYSGKGPGPDRVVINPNYQGACVYVGGMTHTNAQSTNGFVSCVEASSAAGSAATTTTSTRSSTSRTSTSTSTGTGTSTRTSSSSATASPTANAASGLAGIGGLGQGVVMGVAVGLVVL
ncbi:Ribonuclease/ribotoxin [Staphylotrichum tortipilum]|uniref:ribonuclease T1 n=1 Tax=Staphylotrichum tortipilum TaxID=2831512 RepID=A0AAN6MAN4_9PEZI|nr:Ribonuclease/ribotoxin [Staphylotrichum longicolle]